MIYKRHNHHPQPNQQPHLAPLSLASTMLARILSRLPVKSSAHWLRVLTATIALCPMMKASKLSGRP